MSMQLRCYKSWIKSNRNGFSAENKSSIKVRLTGHVLNNLTEQLNNTPNVLNNMTKVRNHKAVALKKLDRIEMIRRKIQNNTFYLTGVTPSRGG